MPSIRDCDHCRRNAPPPNPPRAYCSARYSDSRSGLTSALFRHHSAAGIFHASGCRCTATFHSCRNAFVHSSSSNACRLPAAVHSGSFRPGHAKVGNRHHRRQTVPPCPDTRESWAEKVAGRSKAFPIMPPILYPGCFFLIHPQERPAMHCRLSILLKRPESNNPLDKPPRFRSSMPLICIYMERRR